MSDLAAPAAETKSTPLVDVLARTVQDVPKASQNWGPVGTLTMQLASVGDDVTAWGRSPWQRDKQLREFWPTESVLASTIYATAIRNAAFSWKLDGPPRTVAAVQDMLHAADLGRGWLQFMVKVSIDLLTQDNAAFVELIRSGPSETDPVIGIAHKDSERCRRTGDPLVPVIYRDRLGRQHKLRWYQVITLEEMPSPVETMNGMQICFVSRVLRAAQILRDIAIYKREKIGARGPSSVHLVSGVSQTRIDDAMHKAEEKGDNQGFLRYLMPHLIAGLDPNATVSHVEIPIKSLPDDFDEDVTMRWYISELALGSGNDYQDLAPLPGGGIGSSNQSEILHRKSRGKGPGLFMKLIEHAFAFHGVIPRSVTFHYDEQDTAADKEKADLRQTRADIFGTYIGALKMPYQVVWQMMADEGDITQEQLELLGQKDVTDDVTAQDDEAYETPEDVTPIPGTQTPPAAPAAAAPPPAGAPAATPPPQLATLKGAVAKATPPATEDWNVVQADYRNRLFDALITYAGGEKATRHKNAFRAAVVEDVPGAFYSGYVESGGEDTEPDDEKWLTEQLKAQLGFVDGVFAWVKELRDAGTVTEDAIRARVEDWVTGLAGIYATGKAAGDANQMLTFNGDDGEESCKDCQKWKGKRHSAGYWRKKELLARNGNPKFECGRWDNCHHDFYTDKGQLWSA